VCELGKEQKSDLHTDFDRGGDSARRNHNNNHHNNTFNHDSLDAGLKMAQPFEVSLGPFHPVSSLLPVEVSVWRLDLEIVLVEMAFCGLICGD